MSLPISGFTAIPNPQMPAFLGAQSFIMMYQAGEGWQYGKRRISALSNEEFNKLTPQSLMERQAMELKGAIPIIEKSMNNMTRMIPMMMAQFGDFTREAIKAIPQALANVVADTEGRKVITGGGSSLSFIGGTDLLLAQHKLETNVDVAFAPSTDSPQTIAARSLTDDVKRASIPQLEHLMHEAKRSGSQLYNSFTQKLRITYVIPLIQTWLDTRKGKLKFASAQGIAKKEIETLRRRLDGYISNIKAWTDAGTNPTQRRHFKNKIKLEKAKWQNVSVLLGKRSQKYYDKYGIRI